MYAPSTLSPGHGRTVGTAYSTSTVQGSIAQDIQKQLQKVSAELEGFLQPYR